MSLQLKLKQLNTEWKQIQELIYYSCLSEKNYVTRGNVRVYLETVDISIF